MTAEDKIRRLTQNQAKALSAVVSGTVSAPTVSTSYISTATGLTGRSLGGTVSALERNNLIQPLGRADREFNWELSDPDIREARDKEPEKVKEILDKVAGKK